MFSVVILTKNEEVNLPDCLACVRAHSDDVHLLDSGSTDDTVAIAERHGISVHVHPFTSFGQQRNWAIDNINHKHDWVFHLDADERFTRDLAEEIRQLLREDGGYAGFRVPSKLMLGSSWLKRSGEYPAYQVRLFHRDRLRFTDSGHGQKEVTDGRLGTLQQPYLHFAFRKGIDEWMEKHVRYAFQEALHYRKEKRSLGLDLQNLFSRDPIERRRATKRLSFRLPARGTLRLIHLLLIKRGILDGQAGIAYARMKAIYESMIAVQIAALDAGIASEEGPRS